MRNFSFLSVAVLRREVRGQGQLQSRFSVSLKDSSAERILSDTLLPPQGNQEEGLCRETLPPVLTFQHSINNICCSLTKDGFITPYLICYCIWFCPSNCLLSPVLCHFLCYCWICTTKLNQKREEDIWIYIYRYKYKPFVFKTNEKLKKIKENIFSFQCTKRSVWEDLIFPRWKIMKTHKEKVVLCHVLLWMLFSAKRLFFVRWNVLRWKCCYA